MWCTGVEKTRRWGNTGGKRVLGERAGRGHESRKESPGGRVVPLGGGVLSPHGGRGGGKEARGGGGEIGP